MSIIWITISSHFIPHSNPSGNDYNKKTKENYDQIMRLLMMTTNGHDSHIGASVNSEKAFPVHYLRRPSIIIPAEIYLVSVDERLPWHCKRRKRRWIHSIQLVIRAKAQPWYQFQSFNKMSLLVLLLMTQFNMICSLTLHVFATHEEVDYLKEVSEANRKWKRSRAFRRGILCRSGITGFYYKRRLL